MSDSTADYFSGLPPRVARATSCDCTAGERSVRGERSGWVGLHACHCRTTLDPAEQNGLWVPAWGWPTFSLSGGVLKIFGGNKYVLHVHTCTRYPISQLSYHMRLASVYFVCACSICPVSSRARAAPLVSCAMLSLSPLHHGAHEAHSLSTRAAHHRIMHARAQEQKGNKHTSTRNSDSNRPHNKYRNVQGKQARV